MVREAHVVSSLSHPNIARLLDAGFVGDTFYLTSELVRGTTLGAMIRSCGAVPPPIAVSIIRSILDALEHAHACEDAEGRKLGLVHRDISSGNVMIDRDGAVKLIDFGIAHANIDRYQTEPGVVLGTPAYMSPEQVLAEPVDARTDLYSAAAVLYEALNAAPAILAESLSAMLKAIVKQKPAPFRTQVSEALQSVVFRALEKEPEQRWQSAADFRSALLATPEGRRPASSLELAAWVAEHLPEDLDRGPTLVRAPEENVPTRTEVSPLVEPPIDPLPHAKSTLLRAVVLLALSVVALATVVTVTREEPTRVQSIDPPPPPIEAARRPSAITRTEPQPKPPPPPPPAKPIRAAKAVQPAAPPIAVAPKREEDRIHRMLRELEAQPDPTLFVQLSQALQSKADALPPDEKKVIEAHLAQAEITLKVSALRSAVEALDSFNRAQR
jgi:serine/threonine-protein kinase